MFLMGFPLKLLGFGVFLLLTLSLCQAKNVTVKVVGLIHCTNCIRHEFSSSQASLGVDVFISCKSKNGETKTQGNGAVNKEGKFNVTLSAEIKKDGNSIDGCFAKLQSASAAPCPIQSAQTASLKLLSTDKNATQTAHNSPTIIKFSPVTCQSAFFLPPNFTFFPTLPPPPVQPVEYVPPPSEALPLLAPPIQPPLPPAEDSIPPPSPLAPPTQPPLPPVEYSIPPPSPLAPPTQPPLPPAEYSIPPPAPASEPPSLPPVPTVPPTLSPPDPEFGTPSPLPDLNFRSPSPTSTPNPTFQSPQNPPNPTFKSPSPPPLPIYNSPPPLPKHEKPNAIPRAPPVPRLPPIPKVPRKYFNSPKSKSKPPHSS